MRSLFLLICASVLACAQPAGVKLPNLGFAYDPHLNEIRTIDGIPGAAVLGGGVVTRLALASAVVSPTQELAIAVAIGDSETWLVQLTEPTRVSRLDTATPPIARVVFSPSGRSAVLAGARLQVLSGLPDSPQLRDIAAPEGAPWSAIAVSDDGGTLLLAGGRDARDPVWRLSGAEAVQLPIPGSAAAAAFRAQSKDAIVITKTGDAYLIGSTDRGIETRRLFTGDERTADPAAVFLGADGRRAYTASRSGMLASIDVAAADVAATSCRCAPVTLVPIHSGALFRVTEISTGPVILFDAREAAPRVWFVPPDGREASQRRKP